MTTARTRRLTRSCRRLSAGTCGSALLADHSIGLIVVEHKGRLLCFGFRYLDALLTHQERAIKVVNQAENGPEDLLADLAAMVYHFVPVSLAGDGPSARRKQFVRELESKGESDAIG